MDEFVRQGLRFPVRDGEPSGGTDRPAGPETVVLLHGFPQQPSSFDQIASILQSGGLRTLVPGQRGYSSTARPKRRSGYAAEQTAADVIALLDAAGLDRAHLVGHDWGGGQAWAVAGLHPDRVASLTVLSTPHPTALMRSWLSSSQALKSCYMLFFQLPVLPELAMARTIEKTLRASGLPERYVAEYADAMAHYEARSGPLGWYRGMPFSRRPIGRITVPTSYVWGRNDFALGRTAAELTERFVDAHYRFVELDAGHWLPETHPDEVAELIMERVAG